MARQINIPSRNYTAGQVLSRTVDSFPAGVSKIVATFTRENWPGTREDNVITVQMSWDTGDGVVVTLPGGVVLDKLGVIATTSSIEIGVPLEADQDGNPRNKLSVSGSGTITFHQALRTAITIEAI